MNSNLFRLTGTIVIPMTLLLCGCASGPRLSLPISLTNASRGEVVSLKAVGQDGSGPVFQTAKSVQVPQHWAQPQRTVPAPVPTVTFPPHQRDAWNQSGFQRQQEVAVPWIAEPPQRTPQPARYSEFRQPVIRQVTQQEAQQVAQQQGSPPLVIRWDDHKQSTGRTKTSRRFPAAPFEPPAHAIPSATGQMTQEYCPPESLPLPVANQVGDGCGDVFPSKQINSDQIDKLVKRVEKMEAELTNSRSSIFDLSRSLASARGEITQLKKDVGFWQSEVLRLERSMQAQHRSDIESLNRISQVLENLLQEDRPAAPSLDEGPPDFDLAVDPFAPATR